MGMIVGNEQEKSQLATEISELLARASVCAKFHHSRKNKTPFVNWYLVLRVNENADVDGIRKQYHKLALQLHPDKNKHSKAETAFKLVSEVGFIRAYVHVKIDVLFVCLAYQGASHQTQRGGNNHRKMSENQCNNIKRFSQHQCNKRKRNTGVQPIELPIPGVSSPQNNQSQEAGRFKGRIYDREQLHAGYSQEQLPDLSVPTGKNALYV
ncbi:UNVERIFIED_CONTAM: hypothetical protein Slati_2730900 [Sesamum latifolium]|uniref:J domain-containing protein n=1 Tax=Sesamum latifolium TaxID=2727402 RepID=A0AAW2VZQ8_9LAMI